MILYGKINVFLINPVEIHKGKQKNHITVGAYSDGSQFFGEACMLSFL